MFIDKPMTSSGTAADFRSSAQIGTHPGSLTRWRALVIFGIKSVHSLIFLANSASVMLIFWSGLSGRRSVWIRPALVAVFTESSVFIANHGRCTLTGLVEHLGAQSGRVSDIFLPRWFADRIPLIFGPPLALGLLLASRRWLDWTWPSTRVKWVGAAHG